MDYRKPPKDVNKMFAVKISELSENITYYRIYTVSINDVSDAFKKFGSIGDIYLPKDRYTGKYRGFGFVRFYKEEEAKSAADEMNGTELLGAKISAIVADQSHHRRRYSSRSRSRSSSRSYSPRHRHHHHSDSRSHKHHSHSRRERSVSDSRSRSSSSSRSPSRQY